MNTTIMPSVIEKHTLPDFFYKPFSVSHYYRTVTAGNSVFLYNRTVRRGVLDWTVAVDRLLCDVDNAMLCDTTQRAYRRDTLSLTAASDRVLCGQALRVFSRIKTLKILVFLVIN